MLVCALPAHVGWARCLLDLQRKRGGVLADPVRGARAMAAVRTLEGVLAEVSLVG